MPVSTQQSNLYTLHKMQDKFYWCYDSDLGAGPFCYVKYLERTQKFDKDSLPEV